MKMTMKQNHRMARHNAIIINTMIEKLDKSQQGSLVVDLEKDKGKSKEEDMGISERTRANLKRKAPPSPHMVQTFKRGVQEMQNLEVETMEVLKSLD